MDCGDILCMHASAGTLKPFDAVYHSAPDLRFITVHNYNTHYELYAKDGRLIYNVLTVYLLP